MGKGFAVLDVRLQLKRFLRELDDDVSIAGTRRCALERLAAAPVLVASDRGAQAVRTGAPLGAVGSHSTGYGVQVSAGSCSAVGAVCGSRASTTER